MASRQQRFEGPDLETLLERVRADLGDDARIIAANRVRRGGVGGFFSKEHYEVIVEREPEAALPIVVDLDDDRTLAASPAGASSVLELAEAVNGTERARQGRRKRRSSLADDVATSPAPTAVSPTNQNIEGEPMVDLTTAGSDASVSTESERFAEILDRIARDVETRSNDGGATGRPSHDATADITPTRPLVRGNDGEIYVVDRTVDDLDASLAVETRGPVGTHARADSVRRAARAPRRRNDVGIDDDIAAEAEHITGTALGTAVTPFLPPRVRRTRDVEVIERPENLLHRLGVPARYVPRGVSGAQLRGALIESLAGLPVAAPLPEANGVVIAVVGIGAAPVLLARTLATERGLDPDNLVLATARELGEGIPSWLQICDPATAEERRRSWRRREHETFVAVSIPSVTSGDEWARTMLDHLEPTQTWGIVNAAWKVEDADAWSDRLGGFDVLALEHLADTVSPAAAIALDTPIGRIDGRPASALTWAEVLCERLAER